MTWSGPRRADIQGLRAVAVLLVVVFHVWPSAIPGGYVGVDVFFVISGFLITGLLAREMTRTGTISLRDFYHRRIRRLLPAASALLVTVASATLLFAPRHVWHQIAGDVAASALYVQNWRLAAGAVDYLAADESHGPLRHFWSLAIEEQFYIAWPLLLLATFRLGGGGRNGHLALVGTTLGVLLASLAVSIALTPGDPAVAYLATQSRVWELAAGGLLALAPLTLTGRAAAAAAATGVAAILVSAAVFDAGTAFPGSAALLPVVGTALVIAGCGDSSVNGIARVLGWRPLQALGDASYALYLWHWPILVFFKYQFGESLPVHLGVIAVALSLVAAAASTWGLEARFRRPGPESGSGPVRAAAGGMVLSLLAGVGIAGWVGVATSGVGDRQHPGAAALLDGVGFERSAAFVPALETARRDVPEIYANGCHQRVEAADARGCVVGARGPHPPERTIMLIGDSHAASWVPALDDIGMARNWRIVVHTKSSCVVADQLLELKHLPYGQCSAWSGAVLDTLRTESPDLVLLAGRRDARLAGIPDAAENHRKLTSSLARAISDLRARGYRVAAFRDVPQMPFDPPACLAGGGECVADRSASSATPDALYDAADKSGAWRLDLTDGICAADGCPAVVGNVLVWRDSHHLTKTYSRTLAPYLGRMLAEVFREQAAEAAGRRVGDRTIGLRGKLLDNSTLQTRLVRAGEE